MASLQASVTLRLPSSSVRLVASLSSAMTSPIYGPYHTTSSVGSAIGNATSYVAKLDVTGLSDGTLYYLAVEADGKLFPLRGHARTPVVGSSSFSFATASCAGGAAGSTPNLSLTTGSNYSVFDAIADLGDSVPLQFFMHLGDAGYWNITTSDETKFNDGMSNNLTQRNQRRMFSNLRVPMLTDDHDGGTYGIGGIGNGHYDPTALPGFNSWHNKRVPNPYAAAPSATVAPKFSWVEGRVLMVATSCRTHRTIESATDNSSKTMLGAEQKAWFKQQVDYAAANSLALFWFSGGPLQGTAFDEWGVYTTERAELADYMKSKGMADKVIYFCGDYHMIGMDSGVNRDYATGGGMPICMVNTGPLDQTPTTSTSDTWSVGTSMNTRGQFVQVGVVDNGVSGLAVTMTGKKVASATDKTLTTVLTMNKTITL